MSTPAGTGADSPPERLCGRCRSVIEDDPALFFQTDWVLCPPCAAILLPRSER